MRMRIENEMTWFGSFFTLNLFNLYTAKNAHEVI